ncbi:DUF2971 domain-containing protein [Clostridium botulinum]|nr:DUF2971 domain-containing protein [Clostridium botulinum]MBO0576231.1 DUF2971 domain-containing protein [Clostridium botulinum]
MKIEDIKYEISDKIINEKDFDVEKWRIENPMDYFKAMYLINTSLNRDEVFKVIYQVTRLHIPKTLFKYFSLTDSLSLNEQKLETLQQKKIFMSNAKDLNDPFDNKAYFYKPEVLKKYERLAEHGGKLIDDFSAFTKVSSLTSNNVNSMPMWAHYANNHAGFCVSYDMELNTELSSCTFPIQYTAERIDITSIMDKQVQKIVQEIGKQSQQGKKEILLDDLSLIYMTTYFCNIKHISWSYEREFRCTTGANAKGMPYVSATPKEIYIGKNCKPTYIDRIIKIAKELQVPVFQMIFDDLTSEFNLVARRI